MKVPVMTRGMVQTAVGSIFYLMSDGRDTAQQQQQEPYNAIYEKSPILCFHMSPRSSDEFLEVLPLLAAGNNNNADDDDETKNNDGRVVIAFDLPGYGASENPPRSCTVDEISDACLKAADSILLGTDDIDIDKDEKAVLNYIAVGSLLGNYFCTSLASRYPERIKAAILTNPWFNPEAKGMVKTNTDDNIIPIPDLFVLEDDGSHLTELHSKRSKWLDPELNLRVVQSELAYLANRRRRYPRGINIEGGNDYDFRSAVQTIVEEHQRIGGDDDDGSIKLPFLCIKGDACAKMFDRFGLEGTIRFDEACGLLTAGAGEGNQKNIQIQTLEGDGSTLNVVNQMPDEFAALCMDFLLDYEL